MSEMVERVARALNPKAWLAVDEARKEALSKGWDPILATRHLSAGVDQSILMAQTAIAAMRDPTEEMCAAGQRANKCGCSAVAFKWVYRGMIDEASK